ncbi:MgtC/SapB family protein [Xanthobacter pseudotagetidis]|uniref:MgtC/SapB family protein n=1 Tax=Xanthobacter pseudotagetidis TaxID=3119911 RepID=UPI00372BA1BD
MRFIETFSGPDFADTVVSLLAAFVLGTLIGAERQYRQRTAGLRTNVLVAVGAAAFTDLAARVGTTTDVLRVVANVVTGVGFLGAGVIMKEGLNIRGLNTAATLWCSAAVGACTGADMLAEALLITFIIIAGNTVLRPLAGAIDRIPLNVRASELSYEVHITADAHAVAEVREALIEELETASYPVGDVTSSVQGDAVELVAKLVSTSVDPDELDQVVARLAAAKGVTHANWESTTQD